MKTTKTRIISNDELILEDSSDVLLQDLKVGDIFSLGGTAFLDGREEVPCDRSYEVVKRNLCIYKSWNKQSYHVIVLTVQEISSDNIPYIRKE